jgi:N-acetylneuraminic acid mutarotase
LFFYGGVLTVNKEISVYLNDFWKYDLTENNFYQIHCKLSNRGSHSIVYDTDKRKIYIFGGKNETEIFNDLYEYDIKLDKINKIESLSNPPTVRCNHTAILYKKSLIIFGGWDGTRTLNDMYELSLSNFKTIFSKNVLFHL